MINDIKTVINKIRQCKPLVLNLTNHVTMNFMANALLALGAAPIMSECDDELEELISISAAINLNIGTLDDQFIKRCEKAVKFAKKYHKPVILDPVGAGATAIRTKTAINLMHDVDIVRGNASEIIALDALKSKSLGVEAGNTTDEAICSAYKISRYYDVIVIVSGQCDLVTNGKIDKSINFGSRLMSLVTGMGCVLTAVIAAFRSVRSNSFEASVLATSYFGLCGNLSEQKASAPGSFKACFIDELHMANFGAMERIYDQ